MNYIIFFSCTRKADIKLPSHTPVLVLHGYITVGDTFSISLGKTLRADVAAHDTATYINDGVVLLFENNLFKDSLKFDAARRRYVSSHVIALAGKTYKIIASANNFTTVEATAIAPLPIYTVSLSRIKNARTDATGVPLDDVKFSFNDPSNEKNYYLAALYPAYINASYLCVYTYDPSVEKYSEGLLPFDQNSCIGSHEILYTDKSFNGQLKELVISSNSFSLNEITDPITGIVHKPYLKKFNISEDYYNYFKNTISLSANAGGPTLSDPILIKGNVKNGYGLFTIFSTITDSLP